MIPEWLSTPPSSTLFILLVAMTMTFASSLINRFFTSQQHRGQIAGLRRKIDMLNKEKKENLRKAKSTGDKKLMKKVRKQEQQLLQLQSKMASLSLRQMRVLPITMAMFLIVWMLLTGRILFFPLWEDPFGVRTVALIPWISGTLELNLTYWYLLCSLLFGTLFSRIFGLMGATE